LKKPARKSYLKVKDGQWVKPKMKGYKLACCDCGLVHRIDFKVIRHGRGHKIIFQPFRDRRATAAHRRERKRSQS
jgi:hypothetical protein